MAESFFKQDLFLLGLSLVLGLPILVLVLGELSERLARRGNPLAQGLRQIRHVVLPVLAALFIMRYILGMVGTAGSVRWVETLFWCTVIYAALTIMRNVTQFGEANPTSWIANVPTLFLALARGVVFFWILSHILSGIWGFDLSKLGTVVGLGSVAIGLALQSTIGSLVSGFLMLADRPFKPNDWIVVGGEWMVVKEVNWRTTRLMNYMDDGLVMIPNGSLASETIINYGQEGAVYKMMAFFTFSYDDPPDIVKKVLAEVLSGLDYILSEPSLLTYGFKDYGIQYRVSCSVDFWGSGAIWDQLHERLYFAAKRNGLTLARPIEFQGELGDLQPKLAPQKIADMLRATALFESLDAATIDRLTAGSTVHNYAAGEVIVHQGKPDEGFYVIQTGAVAIAIAVQDGAGQPQDIAHLEAGEFFGEMALLRNEPSPISATATTVVRLLVIDGPLITQLIEQNPQFAMAMNFFLEKRQMTVNTITGMEDGQGDQTVHHDWLDIIKRL
ncbi:MAG: mechanosensitive ion channel family protein [Candidatus Tectomicrobia bacterium]|nr:mechanosensitive ion channel family protein [Candidatus Tectomicrobia bacterium]